MPRTKHSRTKQKYTARANYYMRKTYAYVLKITKKLTLYELLWMLIVVFFYVVLTKWSVEFDENDYTEMNATEPSSNRKYQQILKCPVYVNRTQIETLYPAVVWWNSELGFTPATIKCPNDLYCELFSYITRFQPANVGAYIFYGSMINFDDLPLPRKPQKIIWSLIHEQSPENRPMLVHETTLKLFNFSSTFSRYSDVPFPLLYVGSLKNITSKQYFIDRYTKNWFSSKISPVVFIESDCLTSTERTAYVEKLMEYIPVDSYDVCLNNKQLPPSLKSRSLTRLGDDEVLKFIARYKFMIAIENGVCDDYVTEKFWRPIHVGVVPIYFGSPLIRDWFPNNKSAILLEDYPTPNILSEHLYELMRDDELYEEYLEHKTKGIITNTKLIHEISVRPYQTVSDEIVHNFTCFTCKKVHDIKDQCEVNIVTKSHYNCPKPVSALTLGVLNPINTFAKIWKLTKELSYVLHNEVMNDEACQA